MHLHQFSSVQDAIKALRKACTPSTLPLRSFVSLVFAATLLNKNCTMCPANGEFQFPRGKRGKNERTGDNAVLTQASWSKRLASRISNQSTAQC